MIYESCRRCRPLCSRQVQTRPRISLVSRKKGVSSAQYATKRLHLERDCDSTRSIILGTTPIIVQCVIKDSLPRVITKTTRECTEEESTRATRQVVERRSRRRKRKGIINQNIQDDTDFYALNVVKDSTLNNCTMTM